MKVYVYQDEIWGISFEDALRVPGDEDLMFSFEISSDDIPASEILDMLLYFMGDVIDPSDRAELVVGLLEEYAG